MPQYVVDVPGSHVLPLQQPSGHEVGLQTHCPEAVSHAWPESQAAQASPPVPHAATESDPPETHVLPLQHPVEHDVALQMHWPAVESVPVVSHAWPETQAVQAAPPVPHSLSFSLAYATQVSPLQQPEGHDVALQMHWPAVGSVLVVSHVCPWEQVVHAVPLAPHSALDSPVRSTQVSSLQQPEQREPPQVHAPFAQDWPEEQAAQAAPSLPHSELVSPLSGTHELPLQQPEEQEVALQTHSPVEVLHSWPEAQAAQAAPPVPHWPFFCADAGTHELPLQQPAVQDVALQTHWPLVVSHAWPEAHAAHAAPPAPQPPLVSLASFTHESPSQQPSGHEAGLQTHLPWAVSHVWPAAHATQAAPTAPQAVGVSLTSGTHVEPIRHPEHEVLVSDPTSALGASVAGASVWLVSAWPSLPWWTSCGCAASEAPHPVHGP